jgi:serine/threonine protein kinase
MVDGRRFKRRDPYTAFPVLARPSGPTLVRLLDEHGATMYSSPVDAPSSRILPEYLPLVYQWALDIITGLDFVHSHDVIFGEVSPNQCWLDSNYRVSLLGFINAGFLDKQRWSAVVESDWEDEQLSKGLPTRETDLMLFGYVVYELMTAYAPAIRSGMRPWKNRNVNVPKHQWPRLETAYMGDIVRKCWSGEFASTEEVKTAVVDFLKGLGWEIDADDRLKGLDTKVLFT